MTVAELQNALQLKVYTLPHPDRTVGGGYTGDLLSFVMGRAVSGQAWVTIMSNINVVAVATLTDVSCIILSSDVMPDKEALEKAKMQEINLLSSPLPSFELCAAIAERTDAEQHGRLFGTGGYFDRGTHRPQQRR